MAKFEVASRGLFVLTFAICYDFAFLFQENKSRLASAIATKFGDYFCILLAICMIIRCYLQRNDLLFAANSRAICC